MFDKNVKLAILIASIPMFAVGACGGDDSAPASATNEGDAAPTANEAGSAADAAPPPQDDGAAPVEDADVPDAPRSIQCPADGCQSCADLLARNAGLPSGKYSIDPDGAGSTFSAMDAYCDNDTDGGGWTLVLNYLHADGTNPNVVERSTLPVLVGGTLGDDESTSATAWGHASLALASALSPKEIRFYGATSAHTRIVSFKTNLTGCITYVKTGTGSCTGVESTFTALAGHDAHLPAESNAWMSDKGALALLTYPFYKTSNYHWAVRGGAARWEVDSYSDNTKPAGAFDTLHRVFVR